jgi:hypothetical protein
MLDLDTAFEQQFLDIAVGEVVAQVPADRDDDHLGWEAEPGERRRHRQRYAAASRQPHRTILPDAAIGQRKGATWSSLTVSSPTTPSSVEY